MNSLYTINVCVHLCSLSVQMKEDTDRLEFTAAASDALDRESHKQVQLKQTICSKNKNQKIQIRVNYNWSR